MGAELADVLIGAGLLTPEQASAALAFHGKQGGTLPQAVVELGFCPAGRLAHKLAETLRVALIPSEDFARITESMSSVIPANMAGDFRAVPVRLGGDRLLVALSDPTDRRAMEEIAFFTGLTVVPASASEVDLTAALYHFYRLGGPPPRSGPAAPTWQPGGGQAFPAAAAADVPTLGAPVELPVRVRDEGIHGMASYDAEEMAEPAAPSAAEAASTPLSPAARVASPATPEVQQQYASISWWLGREQEPTVQVRTPRNVEAPAARTETITHDEVLGRLPPDSTLELMMAPEPEGTARPDTQRLGTRAIAQAVVQAVTPQRPTTMRLGRSGPPPVWQSDPMLAELAASTNRQRVVSLVLPYLLQSWARAAMFVVREGMVFGLDGAGESLEPRIIRGMMVPLNAPSVFKAAFDSGDTYVGAPPASTINTMCFKVLGAQPGLVAVVPIALPGGAVVGLLYADSGTSGKAAPGDPRLEVLRAATARALENILLVAKGARR